MKYMWRYEYKGKPLEDLEKAQWYLNLLIDTDRRVMDLITLDFETYYDKDFSLRKMTMESYIRDPRFEVVGVGVKVNNNAYGVGEWYT